MFIKVFSVGALFCLFLSSCNQKTDSFLAQTTDETSNQGITNKALPISTPQPTETPKQDYDSTELDELEKNTFPYGKRTSVPETKENPNYVLSEAECKTAPICIIDTFG